MASTTVRVTSLESAPGTISETKRWYVFPEVNTVTNKGQKRFWRIKVCVVDTNKNKKVAINDDMISNKIIDSKYVSVIVTESGVVGGKIRNTDPVTVKEGKNIGKSNETNVFVQAVLDAFSTYRDKVNASSEKEIPRPMLATDYYKVKSVKWPMYFQCKFDGYRMLSYVEDNAVEFYTRNLKTYENIPSGIYKDTARLYSAAKKVMKELDRSPDDALKLIFDGENYQHGLSLQKHGALRKKYSPQVEPDSDIQSKFLVFDVFDTTLPEMPYTERLQLLTKIFLRAKNKKDLANVSLVHTVLVKNIQEANERVESCLEDGYEGGMLRVPNAAYKQSRNGYHSTVLLKLKPRYDDEFEVIGFSGGESKGKEEGAILIICETEDGKKFTVQPALTLKVRKDLFEKYSKSPELFSEELMGKLIIVKYDDLSDDKVPLRAKTELKIRTDK